MSENFKPRGKLKGKAKLRLTMVYLGTAALAVLIILGIVLASLSIFGDDAEHINIQIPSLEPKLPAVSEVTSEVASYEPEPESAVTSVAPPEQSTVPSTPSVAPPAPSAAPPPPPQNEPNAHPAASFVQPAGANWYKRLVNYHNRLDGNFSPNLQTLSGSTQRVDARIVDPLERMMASARATGATIWVQSGYRDFAHQTRIFNNRVNRYTEQGVSQAQAEINASRWIARPGSSEHQSGLAVDFNCITMAFQNTTAYTWLVANAHNYGFILRYPPNTTHITGVNHEPWHFRYVGVTHATEIHRRGITLEEYVLWYNSR